jgi:two-component system chemotaxis response regulator CheB
MEKDSLKRSFNLVVIGGSAGSFDVILKIIGQLKPEFKIPVIIVLHRKIDTENVIVEVISSRTILQVKEVEDKELLTDRTIYIAPADYHLLIEKDLVLSLDASEKVNYCRPSIDVTFQSASEVFESSLACILLSGANADGVEGLREVKAAGGLTIVQDPKTAEVSYMPQQAIDNVPVDLVVMPDELAEILNTL